MGLFRGKEATGQPWLWAVQREGVMKQNIRTLVVPTGCRGSQDLNQQMDVDG